MSEKKKDKEKKKPDESTYIIIEESLRGYRKNKKDKDKEE